MSHARDYMPCTVNSKQSTYVDKDVNCSNQHGWWLSSQRKRHEWLIVYTLLTVVKSIDLLLSVIRQSTLLEHNIAYILMKEDIKSRVNNTDTIVCTQWTLQESIMAHYCFHSCILNAQVPWRSTKSQRVLYVCGQKLLLTGGMQTTMLTNTSNPKVSSTQLVVARDSNKRI